MEHSGADPAARSMVCSSRRVLTHYSHALFGDVNTGMISEWIYGQRITAPVATQFIIRLSIKSQRRIRGRSEIAG